MAVIIPDANNIIAMFAEHDKTYTSLFEDLNLATERLSNNNISIDERYSVIASSEFLAVRLLVLIKVEKERLDSLITFKDHLSTIIIQKLATRKNKLIEKEKNVEDIINAFKSTAYIVYNTKTIH